MTMGTTQKQQQVYKFLREYIMEHGIAPSIEEIRVGVKLKSRSGIHRLLQGLEERGWIRRIYGRSRAIELCQEPVTSTIDLTDPLLRQALIAAGWTPPETQRKAA